LQDSSDNTIKSIHDEVIENIKYQSEMNKQEIEEINVKIKGLEDDLGMTKESIKIL